MIRTLTLTLDEDDYDALCRAMAVRQTFRVPGEAGTLLPPGKSDLAGALLAEIARAWLEFLDHSPDEGD